jgi:FkbM family methyltransferase
MLKYAPNGNHLAFEPLPHLYAQLNKTYPQVKVYDYALSDKIDQVTFNHVTNAEEYSGLKIRKYNISNPIIQQIQVKTAPLDDFVTSPIDFIKIDVEGAEYSVLKGAAQTLKKYAPLLIFEFGQGASEYYGTNPIDLFHFLVKDHRYHIFTLKEFIDNKTSLSLTQFISHYENNSEYYFVASKSIS